MRLLLIHSDYIEYEAKKKTKIAEEVAVLEDRHEEALVVFTAVESADQDDIFRGDCTGSGRGQADRSETSVSVIFLFTRTAHLSMTWLALTSLLRS